jgi:hypothetical protein
MNARYAILRCSSSPRRDYCTSIGSAPIQYIKESQNGQATRHQHQQKFSRGLCRRGCHNPFQTASMEFWHAPDRQPGTLETRTPSTLTIHLQHSHIAHQQANQPADQPTRQTQRGDLQRTATSAAADPRCSCRCIIQHEATPTAAPSSAVPGAARSPLRWTPCTSSCCKLHPSPSIAGTI